MSIYKSSRLSIPLKVCVPRFKHSARLPVHQIILTVLDQYPYANPRAIRCIYYPDPERFEGIFNILCPICELNRWNLNVFSFSNFISKIKYEDKIVIMSRGFFVLEGWLQFHAWVGLCNKCNNIVYSYDGDSS